MKLSFMSLVLIIVASPLAAWDLKPLPSSTPGHVFPEQIPNLRKQRPTALTEEERFFEAAQKCFPQKMQRLPSPNNGFLNRSGRDEAPVSDALRKQIDQIQTGIAREREASELQECLVKAVDLVTRTMEANIECERKSRSKDHTY